MNKALRRLSLAMLVMFLALLLGVNYLQGFQASRLAAEPGNVRIFEQQFQYQRGPIVAVGPNDSESTTLAWSSLVKGGTTYRRHYKNGPVYAPVTGYDSIFSATGIEGAEDSLLAGTAPSLAVHNLIGLITGKSRIGATVDVTIDWRAQRAAYQALAAEGRPGAVVAIDPATGAIIAMASYPSYSPNLYTTVNSKQLVAIDTRLRHEPSQPLLNRAIDATYPPGSSFKIVTSSAAFGTGKVAGVQTPISAPTDYPLPGSTAVLHNDDDGPCDDGNPPIIIAFTLSCNTAFGKLGATKVGGAALHQYAERYGFNDSRLTVPMPVTPSLFPLETDPARVALSAIGQFDNTVTPLQEAMLAATIANRGVLMRPYLVSKVIGPDLQTIQQAAPAQLGSQPVLSQADAFKLKQMMLSVTHNPEGTAFATASPAAADGISIAGKTGTAQNGINNSGLNDAVFSCFGPVVRGQTPPIAVGVIVQGGGFGAAAAAPIAVQVIEAYLKGKP